jgi:ankyrin repeat protein
VVSFISHSFIHFDIKMAHNNNNGALPAPPEWDLLLSAAQKNRPDLIRSMVQDDGVDPSHANGVGQSALHVAALWGHTDAVECLLQVGANVAARNSLTGATPLHMVVSSHKGTLANKLQVVDLLLQHDNGIHNLAAMTDQYGRLPIDYLLASMTTENENDNNNASSSGSSTSTAEEQEAYVAAMTEKLKPVDPPLFAAICAVDVAKVQELLLTQQDAIMIVNSTFRNATPVSKTVQLLVATAEQVAATAAATEGSSSSTSSTKMQHLVEILNRILKSGGDPNLPESITAATSSPVGEIVDPPLVQVLHALVEAYREHQHHQQDKDETNTCTTTTATATSSCIIAALQAAAVALHQAGGVLTANQLAEFLHASARGSAGGLPMVQFLLSAKGASDGADAGGGGGLALDVNATNRQSMTPLQFAARSGRVEIVQYLLSLHDDNMASSSSSSSSLHSLNVHHQDNAGQTALDAARKNNKEQVVKILEEYIQGHHGGGGDAPPSSAG